MTPNLLSARIRLVGLINGLEARPRGFSRVRSCLNIPAFLLWSAVACAILWSTRVEATDSRSGACPSSQVCQQSTPYGTAGCIIPGQEIPSQRKVFVRLLEKELGKGRGRFSPASPDHWTKLTQAIEDWVDSLKREPHHVRDQLAAALQRAQSECRTAFRRLEDRFRIAGPSAEGWREYLEFSRLSELMELEKSWPGEVLEKTYQRLAAGYPGLELRCFADLREALRAYLLRERSLLDEQIATRVVEVGQQLLEAVRGYSREPSAEKLMEIYQTFSWLRILGLEGDWASELTTVFDGPNLRVRFSERLIQAAVDRPVDDTGPFEDVILGTYLVGTSRTRGHLRAFLVPSETAALVGLVLEGTIHTDARGFNGPVQVLTRGQTSITAEKLLGFGRKELVSSPTYSEACTDSELLNLWAIRGGALVEAIAWRRAWSQKPLADAIAAEHAEARMNERLDKEIGKRLAEANRQFSSRIWDPLEDRGLYPQTVAWRTTASFVEGLLWQKGKLGLGSPSLPPRIFMDQDLVLGIHETAINFALSETFAGMILREVELRKWAEDFWGQVPPGLEVEDPTEPWTIVFASERPIEVAFRGDLLSITLRGQAYEKGDKSFPGMDVTAIYRIEDSPEGRVAVRQGDLRIYPPRFKEEERKLTAREQVLRTLLARRFAKLFPERWAGPRIEWMPKGSERPSPIVLTTAGWTTIDGWLFMGWNLSQ